MSVAESFLEVAGFRVFHECPFLFSSGLRDKKEK